MSGSPDAAKAKGKKKTSSPRQTEGQSRFRVKVGYMVALRHLSGGNSVKIVRNAAKAEAVDFSSFLSLWTNPLPGRDGYLSLVGKRIRCFFPKEITSQRVLEGEIVFVYDLTGRKRKPGKPYKVELLVDKNIYEQHFKFLTRVDSDVDSKTLSTKARRYRELEDKIRGKNKAVVIVKLADPAYMDVTPKALKWVIQKSVPSKLFHQPNTRSQQTSDESKGEDKKATTNTSKTSNKRRKISTTEVRHVGDGNDAVDQQVSNWRWLSSRYHDMLLMKKTATKWDAKVLSLGFVGEVTKVEQGLEPPSLATVSIRRLFLPEHTATGRQAYHGDTDIFGDRPDDSDGEVIFKIPIEELIVLSKKLTVGIGSASLPDGLVVSSMYSLVNDSYSPSEASQHQEVHVSSTKCHRCSKVLFGTEHSVCTAGDCPAAVPGQTSGTVWCSSCLESLGAPSSGVFPCCARRCNCRECLSRRGSGAHISFERAVLGAVAPVGEQVSLFARCSSLLSSINIQDFGVPNDLLSPPLPSLSATTRSKPKYTRKVWKIKGKHSKSTRGDKRQIAIEGSNSNGSSPVKIEPGEDYSIFKPTSARLLPYDPSAKHRSHSVQPPTVHEAIRNQREFVHKRIDAEENGDRATRANHRRLRKGLGRSGTMDILSQRAAPKVRFERSGIHAWGVFAEEDIGAEEMIIEYRGELIGNAMAEKREVLYEDAKIGSDYMFRIDDKLVCDATKQGNMARFINASCDPNCYTKIISLDGSKRIVIYSKRDISAGEELSYDYKFPLEYDESKRVPCYCGAKECRGFMNWNKKYVAMPKTPPSLPNAAAGSKVDEKLASESECVDQT